MTEREFPFRSFTMRDEGYDRNEVDAYVGDLRREIVELGRALETATPSGDGPGDTRLHDPEGAVTRTLAIAQETADRVLHDAQVEADRRRTEADEQATNTLADAEERAERLLTDIEAQAAEVREQGVAAARSAIRVERDRAMSELSHVRRIRNSLRAEAADLKTALDMFRSQSRAASDTLAAAASGPLMTIDLPEYVDDDVMLAGIVPEADEAADLADKGFEPSTASPASPSPSPSSSSSSSASAAAPVAPGSPAPAASPASPASPAPSAPPAYLRSVHLDEVAEPEVVAEQRPPMPAFSQAAFASDDDDVVDPGPGVFEWADDGRLADVIALDNDPVPAPDADAAGGRGSGAFLAEVRAAAEDDVALAPENDESDRFLSELRELTDEADQGLDSEAADRFFDD